MIFLVLFALFPFAYSLPTGAPCSQIHRMTPNHRGGVYKDPPFRISVGVACYTPGNIITVTLKGKTPDATFKGFVLQARPVCLENGATEKRAGKFRGSHKDWRFQCKNDQTSVTHTWNDVKKEVKVDWFINHDSLGTIRFISTVVKEYSSFWVQQVKSIPLKPCGKKELKCENDSKTDENKEEKPTGRNLVLKSISTPIIFQRPKRCSLPVEKGYFCGAGYTERYHYNGVSCKHFWYGGCGGNLNNFFSVDSCNNTCMQRALVAIAKPGASVCDQETAAVGTWCRPPGGKDYWSWSETSQSCVPFHYLGCSGNKNKFLTERECVDACANKSCRRLLDANKTCRSWVKSNYNLCSPSGSATVRHQCKRSCCNFYGER